jgi:hypothetical protein
MKKEQIYLVIADTSYEGSSPICAFDDESDAKVFQQKCYAYHLTVPHAPSEPICDTPENDKLYEKFFAKKQRWSNRHPAGANNSSCDTFSVIKIPKVSNV